MWLDALRVVPVLFVLIVPFNLSFGDDVARGAVSTSTSASCPDGVGRGGDTATSGADTYGGNGCVVFEYDGQFTTFTYSGSVQSWTVPSGVTSLTVHAIGAGGGGGKSGTTAYGGGGGYATGRLSVAAGQQFDVIVGGGGRRLCAADVPALSDVTGRHNFSYGGGGAGNGQPMYNCSFAAGGGRSAVRVAGGVDDLVTAGGGGGGGYTGAGGAGGGLVGSVGGGSGGGGGTQSAGGATATPEPGVAGIKYAGGWAGFHASNDNAASEGGGGGGGYYGGGAAGDNGGGGGGSSYLGSLSSASTTAATGRVAGIGVPASSSAPSVPATGVIGTSLAGVAGTWTYSGISTYKWQYSTNGSTYADVAGATELNLVPNDPGFYRLVETKSNFLGAVTATSSAATVADTRLSALVPSAGSLSPSFVSSRRAYTLNVGYRTASIRLSPTVSSGAATVRVAGSVVVSGNESTSIDLAVGDTNVVVRVELGGAATETVVVVTRAAAVAPSAPTITSVDEGDGTLAVKFDAPTDDGGESITGYEYSLDGVTWSAVAVSAGRFEVSGLTNATSYSLRLRAVNSVGAGTSSATVAASPKAPLVSTTSTSPAATTSSSVVPGSPPTSATTSTVVPETTTTERTRRSPRPSTATTTDVTTTTSSVAAAESSATTSAAPPVATTVEESAAVESPTTVVETTVPSSTIVEPAAKNDELAFELVPEFGVGEPAAGARVRASATGLAPMTVVRLHVHSEPVLLAEGQTDADGVAQLSAALPGDLQPGAHMLSLTGVAPTGETLVSAVGLEIDERGVISGVTAASDTMTTLPDESQVQKMVATKSAPYDARRDVSGAVALAGAAVVLMALAGGGSSAAGDDAGDDSGDGDTGDSGSAEPERDESAEGSLASADAKVMRLSTDDRAAWGDRSRLWALPGWIGFLAALRWTVRRVERWSTLAVRVIQDGSWGRAVFGVGAGIPWVLGVAIGVAAGRSVDGLATPPTFGFVVAIVALSFVDSLAGAFAWFGYVAVVVLSGGLSSWFDFRTLLGMGALFVVLPLIAASFRPVVRSIADGAGFTSVRAFDYLVVPLFVSFAAASVYGALNGLSGLSVVSDDDTTKLRWVCLGLAVGRMLVEDASLAWFPSRRIAASVAVERPTLSAMSYVNIGVMLGIYVLMASPYMGGGPRTWLVMSMMVIVPFVKIHKDKLPNVSGLHRWFPRGILRSVIMLYAMAWYGRWVIDATGGDAKSAVPLTLIPGIAIGLIDCVGRSGGTWAESRAKNVAGVVLWVVSFSVVAGWVTP